MTLEKGRSMKNALRCRPRASMVVAILALVVAMTGSAVAGSKFLPSKKFKNFKSTAVTRLTYVNTTQSVPVGSGDFTTVIANCPSGYHPIGGGVKLTPSTQNFWWDDGYLTPTGYASKIANNAAESRTAVVTVACVAANATGAPAG
jgi:hypothetical protein